MNSMVQITIDTDRDSPSMIQHIIRLLEEELQRRGGQPIQPRPFEPMRVQAEPSTPSSENSVTDMFGSSAPSTPSMPESSPPTSTPDMFSVFGHDAPSTEPEPMQSAESFISSQMTSTPQDTPSASQLIDEEDVHDVTEDLARQVWSKGSTRKPDNSYNLEPY